MTQWRPRCPKRAARVPEVVQKRPFWRPRGPHFQAKSPIMNSYKNIDIYYGLDTFKGVSGRPFGHSKTYFEPFRSPVPILGHFFRLSGRPGNAQEPKRDPKGVPKGTRGDPKCTPYWSKIRSGSPRGAKGVPGVPPGPEMTPKIVRKRSQMSPKSSRNRFKTKRH